ncbi:SUMF1/EgtB/PvdO family nonheme iron enzyme [Spirochaetota bacterium]
MNLEKSFFEIPAGTYKIGLNRDVIEQRFLSLNDAKIKKEYLHNSFPRHDVELKAALISRTLVTYSEFKLFVNETGYVTEAEVDGWGWVFIDGWIKRDGVSWRKPFCDDADIIYLEEGTIVPVMQVSWNDAIAYCSWLSGKGKEDIRLPFEEEWEVFFSTMQMESGAGDDMNSIGNVTGSANYIMALLSAMKEDKEFNPAGLLWEWTMNWFDKYPGGDNNAEFGEVYKILRGGSILSHPVQRTGEFRFRRCPTARSPYYGFRIARWA